MPVRILTIPFDPANALFHDEELNRFLLNKHVEAMQAEFFMIDAKAFWSVFVRYEPLLAEEDKRSADELDDRQSLLMRRLKEWRKEKADKEGIPPFIIATNKELLEIVKKTPASLEALKDVHGFGKKKVARHGREIVSIVRGIHEKEPTPAREPASSSEECTEDQEAQTSPTIPTEQP